MDGGGLFVLYQDSGLFDTHDTLIKVTRDSKEMHLYHYSAVRTINESNESVTPHISDMQRNIS